MRKTRSLLVLFMLLVFGLFVTFPAEDAPETAYDESEALPYESTPLISDVMPEAGASATQATRSDMRRQLSTTLPVAGTRINGTDAQRSNQARVALALLCTLLC